MQGTAENLPVPEHSATVVWSVATVHHWADVTAGLAEVRRVLSPGGRFLVIGFTAGEIPKIPINLVLLRSSAIVGVFWGAWAERNPQAHRANMADIARWCAEGKLSAHIHAVYPLEKTAEAIKALSNRKAMGKLLLRP